MKSLISLLAAVMLLSSVILTGCMDHGEGTLTGRVTIGPLCPVEPCNVTPATLTAAYEARKVEVYTLNGNDLVTTASIGPDGRYSVPLIAGNYVVDINRAGMDRSADVPRSVTITPGKVTVLDIDIDTGLR